MSISINICKYVGNQLLGFCCMVVYMCLSLKILVRYMYINSPKTKCIKTSKLCSLPEWPYWKKNWFVFYSDSHCTTVILRTCKLYEYCNYCKHCWAMTGSFDRLINLHLHDNPSFCKINFWMAWIFFIRQQYLFLLVAKRLKSTSL